jgi:anti-sigma factor RsiW
MIRHSDGSLVLETLLAYADGALADADAARISAALTTDPEAARLVDALRATGALAAAAFDDVIAEPVPPRLLAAASGRGAVRKLAGRGTARPAGPVNGNWRRLGAAVAAGLLLLMVGIAGGHWMAKMETGPDLQPAGTDPTAGIGDPQALGALYALLSDAPVAGGSIAYGGGRIALEAPMALVDGAICWQFRLLPAAAPSVSGIACPEATGGWAVLTLGARGATP